MTYNKLYEQLYGVRADSYTEEVLQRKALIEALPEPVRRAWHVVDFFLKLKGFDHWWDNIDDDTQDDLFAELVKEMERPSLNHQR